MQIRYRWVQRQYKCQGPCQYQSQFVAMPNFQSQLISSSMLAMASCYSILYWIARCYHGNYNIAIGHQQNNSRQQASTIIVLRRATWHNSHSQQAHHLTVSRIRTNKVTVLEPVLQPTTTQLSIQMKCNMPNNNTPLRFQYIWPYVHVACYCNIYYCCCHTYRYTCS